jgi:hypothetical protein
LLRINFRRDELERLDEQRAQYQALTVDGTSNSVSDEELKAFNDRYVKTFKKARRIADRNLRRQTSRKARSQTLCWDILKRLRPSGGNLEIRQLFSFRWRPIGGSSEGSNVIFKDKSFLTL